MKSIDRYILEKFQITKDSKLLFTCHPEDKFELREILEKRLAKNKNADLNDIDVSYITDMGRQGFSKNGGLFVNLDPHNIKIDQWDVHNVETMVSMFTKSQFTGENGNISNWNIKPNVRMSSMFKKCPLEKNPPSWYHKK